MFIQIISTVHKGPQTITRCLEILCNVRTRYLKFNSCSGSIQEVTFNSLLRNQTKSEVIILLKALKVTNKPYHNN